MITRRELIAAASALLVTRPALSQVVSSEIDKIVDNSFSHRTMESSAFRYSFGEDELQSIARQSETALIVHHGKPVPIDGYVAIHHHLEGLPIYTPNAASVDQLQVAQVR